MLKMTIITIFWDMLFCREKGKWIRSGCWTVIMTGGPLIAGLSQGSVKEYGKRHHLGRDLGASRRRNLKHNTNPKHQSPNQCQRDECLTLQCISPKAICDEILSFSKMCKTVCLCESRNTLTARNQRRNTSLQRWSNVKMLHRRLYDLVSTYCVDRFKFIWITMVFTQTVPTTVPPSGLYPSLGMCNQG